MTHTVPVGSLCRNGSGQLEFTTPDGEVHVDVIPVRAFALTAPEDGIALLSATGKELSWIENLGDLPPPMQILIRETLAEREFMPVIHRIVGVSGYATPSTWTVETDRGSTTLILKSEDDIRRLRQRGALLIGDSRGIHFMIHDRFALDASSQKILQRFL